MITTPTVFIIGAGASAPYGFPTGNQLKTNICNSGFLRRLEEVLNKAPNSKSELIQEELKSFEIFQQKFALSATPSIDLFISRLPRYIPLAKKAIIIDILDAESRSNFGRGIEYQEHDWYTYIYQRMTEKLFNGNDYVHFPKNNVSFITFNYDRSLEDFLYTSLEYSFEIDFIELPLSEILNQVNIVHIYGQIGALDWQVDYKNKTSAIPYRAPASYGILNNHLNDIFTIHDQRAKKINAQAIELIRNAKRIFFLGFGYSPENLKILDIPNSIKSDQQIIGTAFGMKKGEIERIKRFVGNNYLSSSSVSKLSDIKIEDCGCLDLLREYL